MNKAEMLPLQVACDQLLNTIAAQWSFQHESVSLWDAAERVLAEDIYSPFPVPRENNSAMDGYALRFSDIQQTTGNESALQWFPLSGQSIAGHAFNGDFVAGSAIRITTGALVPVGCDTVVMQEYIEKSPDGSAIRLKTMPSDGDYVRRQGEELAQGQLVLPKGTMLGPLQLGLLATLGIASCQVFRKIRVAVISTGDELQQPGLPLAQGQLYDSNRIVLHTVLTRLGCKVTDGGWVADQPEALKDRLLNLASQHDVLISSGGVSVGDSDFTRQVLADLGSVHFWKVAIKPGKPFAFGSVQQAGKHCWFFGLPGNPVSAVTTCEQLVVPALNYLQGRAAAEKTLWPARAAQPFRKTPGRLDMQRVRIQVQEHGVSVEAAGIDSSAMLTSLLQADGLVWLEQNRGNVAAGENVQVQPKSPWWY